MPAEAYFTPPTVSAASARARTAGTFTTVPEPSSTGALVIFGLVGASLLGFGAWLLTREDDAPTRRGSRR